MRNPNNRRYPDGFIRTRRHQNVVTRRIMTADLAIAARLHEQNQLREAKRVRLVASFMIQAAGKDSHSSRLRYQQRRRRIIKLFKGIRQNIPRYAAVGLLTIFTVTSVLMPLLQADDENRLLQLDMQRKQLVGDTRDDAAKYLKYDAKNKTYTFAAEQHDTSGSYDHTGRTADAYEATLPQKAPEGITVTDTGSKIDITLTPQFFTTPAKKTDGNNVVYQSGNRQLVYTLKYNGLKEDIILPSYQGDELQFAFKLALPKGVEARLDTDGNIGIYSADLKLFGDISFGSDADRQKVELARDKAEKNNLVMTIPYPVVKDASGKQFLDRAHYTLGNREIIKRNIPNKVDDQPQLAEYNSYVLGIRTQDLKQLSYPISIDPTVQVKSASDFAGLNNDMNAEIDTTNNLIKRANLTGGSVGSWTTDTDVLPEDGATKMAGAFYNGRLYVHGGFNQNAGNNHVTNILYMATVDPATGDIGPWTSAGTLGGASTHNIMFYNGYVYRDGDSAGSSGSLSYAKVNADGTIGTAQSATSYTPGRRFTRALIYNGYIYISGGCSAFGNVFDSQDCTTWQADVRYAPIQPDGSVGAWASAGPNFTQSRGGHNFVAYNGYLYVFNGTNDDGPSYDFTQVQYAPINSDGTIGSWSTTTNTLANSTYAGAFAFKGYMYVVNTTVTYAPIYGNGTLGAWQTTTAYNGSGRNEIVAMAANNFIYFGTGITYGTPNVYYPSFQYAAIKSPAETTNRTTLSDFDTTGRYYASSVAYNGYLYVTGGATDLAGSTYTTSIRVAQINNDGSLGTWGNASTTFSKARFKHSVAIYKNYIYVFGGYGNCGSLGVPDYCNDVQYASITGGATLGSWTTSSNNLLVGRSAFAGVNYNGYLYVIGGRTSAGVQSDIDYAQIQPDNSVGVWQNNPTGLSRAQELHAATASGGYVYLTGGVPGGTSTVYLDIQYSKIDMSNGQLGTWTMVDPGNVGSWGATKYGHMVWVYNGYLYQASGCAINNSGGSCTNNTNDVQYRKLNADGTVGGGNWFSASSGITSDFRAGMTGVMYNGFYYSMGGIASGASATSKDVNRLTINNGGSGAAGTWATSSNQMTTSRYHGGVAISNGYIYMIGGCSNNVNSDGSQCSASTKTVEHAAISATGNISPWSSADASISTAVAYMSVVAHQGYIYVIGGCTGFALIGQRLCNGTTDVIQYAAANGTITSWLTSGTVVPGGGSQQAPITAYNGYLYMTIGVTSYYSQINQNSHDLVGWTPGSNILVNAFSGSMVTNGKYIYVIGGYDGSQHAIVQYAPLNTDHTIGTWKYTTSLNKRRADGVNVAIANGYIYAVGGFLAETTEEHAPINADGTLGSWQFGSFLSSNIGSGGTGMIYNGRFYVVGGLVSNSAALKTLQYATIQSIPRVAQLSKLYDFEIGVKPTKLITRGTKLTGSYTAVTYSTNNAATGSITMDNAQAISDIAYSGPNALTINLGTNRTLSRYLFLRYTLDDTQSGVFPDSGNESTITDFDMYYTSNPGDRLRGGRTFTNGSDRGLEANPQ